MSFSELALIVPLGLLVGFLIGAVGIGGVLLAPALVNIAGFDPHAAVATCMLTYLFSGATGTLGYARHGSIEWRQGLWLALAALPGAFVGALLMSRTPAQVIELLMAALILFGAWRVAQRAAPDGVERVVPAPVMGGLGLVVGIGSAMSGTGGPALLIPALLALRASPLLAIGLGQTIQVPVSLAATVGNALEGQVNWTFGVVLGMCMVAGVSLGVALAHRLAAGALRRALAALLAVLGAVLVLQVLFG